MEFEKVCRIISEVLGVDPGEIVPEATFSEDLGADSLDVYQIVLKVENEFEIKLEAEAVEEVRTVAELVELIINQ